jgi:peptide/nickel transport system permease protein
MAVVIGVVVAIPCGVISAVKQDSLVDYGLRFFSMIFESMPNFWLGLLLLVALAIIFE